MHLFTFLVLLILVKKITRALISVKAALPYSGHVTIKYLAKTFVEEVGVCFKGKDKRTKGFVGS